MSGAWDLTSLDFVHLRGDGGHKFVRMMNALLRAEATTSNVPISAVHLTERVNEGDGGVDAVVDSQLRQPVDTSAPGSFWQFKGTAAPAVSVSKLAEEIVKPEVQRRLAEGLQYVICVCDDLTEPKVRKREEWLAAAAHKTAPNAPRPRLLTIGHLITWLYSHPGVVASHLRTNMHGVRGHAHWLADVRASLPKYVPLPSRAEVVRELQDFGERENAGAPVLALASDSGLGATRLVAESLVSLDEKVIVADPDEALRVIHVLVGRPGARALLIVDHCSLRLRERLEEALRGASARVRAVVIHEPSERVTNALHLKAPEEPELAQILKENFPRLSQDEQRAVTHLADGLIKIGAYLARVALDGQTAWLHRADAWAIDELNVLVKDVHDVRVLRALALFERVGMSGEIADQLELVSSLFSMNPHDTRSRVHELSKLGLTTIGPRYVTVRPRLFAKVCFDRAWTELPASRYSTWRGTLTPELHSSFLRQAARFASDSARRMIVQSEIRELGELLPMDMLQQVRGQRLLQLLEIEPVSIARRLAELIDAMTTEQRVAPGEQLHSWRARQHWIKALEDLLSRTDTYGLAENALFRLARAEPAPDPDSGGGTRCGQATEAWLDGYLVWLSGTPVPYSVRFERLASKLKSDSGAAPWVIVAAGRALDSHASKILGPPIVAGQVRAADWRPKTYGEWSDCRDSALRLLGRCLNMPSHRAHAFGVFARFGWSLLSEGNLTVLREVLDAAALDAVERSQVRHFIEQYLDHEVRQAKQAAESESNAGRDAPRAREEYLERVREWRVALQPQGLLQQLFEALQADGERVHESFDELAAGLLHEDFLEIMGRLRPQGRHFHRLYDLGFALGKQDTESGLLESIVAPSNEAPVLLARGYIEGLGRRPEHDAPVRTTLDTLEQSSPAWCLDLAAFHPRVGVVGDRALRLVREGRLGIEALTSVYAIRFRGERLHDALRLVLADTGDEEKRATVALALCAYWGHHGDRFPENQEAQGQLWDVLELAAKSDSGEAHVWGELLSHLAGTAPHRAAELACRVAEHGKYFVSGQAASALGRMVTSHPATVLEVIGETLLSMPSWQAGLSKTAPLLGLIDDEMLFAWLESKGPAAAKVLAFHLPEPFVDEQDGPSLHVRTDRFLRTFGQDSDVIENFCHPAYQSGLYSGDIAMQHEREAARARPFLNHEYPAVRRWAEREVDDSEHSATYWRAVEEERRSRDV